MSWNRVEILGRVMSDPDFKYGASGKPYLRLWVGGGTQKSPMRIDVMCFGELAEECQQIKKGDDIALIGRLQEDQWEDKTTGAKRTKHKIMASKVSTSSRFSHEMREEMEKRREPQGAPQAPGVVDDDDDLPF